MGLEFDGAGVSTARTILVGMESRKIRGDFVGRGTDVSGTDGGASIDLNRFEPTRDRVLDGKVSTVGVDIAIYDDIGWNKQVVGTKREQIQRGGAHGRCLEGDIFARTNKLTNIYCVEVEHLHEQIAAFASFPYQTFRRFILPRGTVVAPLDVPGGIGADVQAGTSGGRQVQHIVAGISIDITVGIFRQNGGDQTIFQRLKKAGPHEAGVGLRPKESPHSQL